MQLEEAERRVVHHMLRELIKTDQGLSVLGMTKYHEEVAGVLFSHLDHEFGDRPSIALRDGMTCEDEGCPHYGTKHSHVGD